jgi:hypothetical protein
MFDQFKQRYQVTSRLPPGPPGTILRSPLEDTPGYEEFMREYAGATFNNGVYRVHTLEGRAKWERLIKGAFPRFRGQFSVFGYDWLGRQFALDSKRREDGRVLVVMFEPGTGDVLEIPRTFCGFHEGELIEDSDAPLADRFFEEWLRSGHRGPNPTECIGYNVPLFLSGEDTIENLELGDMEVYWDIIAQLLDQTRDLPAGTRIGSIKIE